MSACRVVGKTRYGTRTDAQRTADHIRERTLGKRPAVYFCYGCNGYHLALRERKRLNP